MLIDTTAAVAKAIVTRVLFGTLGFWITTTAFQNVLTFANVTYGEKQKCCGSEDICVNHNVCCVPQYHHSSEKWTLKCQSVPMSSKQSAYSRFDKAKLKNRFVSKLPCVSFSVHVSFLTNQKKFLEEND